ncbi:hypothetical protein DOU54_12895 [Agrobacterium sp. MS2]|nr:hypothetical protein DOU54_12895 [Agrobacterium sp. MS2]
MCAILVTGASGFIGSFLMEEMKHQNLPVVGVSRFPKPGLLTIPVQGKAVNWDPLLKDVDTVVHLAARVHVMKDRDLFEQERTDEPDDCIVVWKDAHDIGSLLDLAVEALDRVCGM